MSDLELDADFCCLGCDADGINDCDEAGVDEGVLDCELEGCELAIEGRASDFCEDEPFGTLSTTIASGSVSAPKGVSTTLAAATLPLDGFISGAKEAVGGGLGVVDRLSVSDGFAAGSSSVSIQLMSNAPDLPFAFLAADAAEAANFAFFAGGKNSSSSSMRSIAGLGRLPISLTGVSTSAEGSLDTVTTGTGSETGAVVIGAEEAGVETLMGASVGATSDFVFSR